jgi:hypothetical protein
MTDAKTKMPDELFAYRFFCQGAQIKFLSSAKSVKEMWNIVRATDAVEGYEQSSEGGYVDIIVRSSAVLAIDQPVGTSPIYPNRTERRRDAVPPEPKMPPVGQIAKSRTLSRLAGTEVQSGTVAPKKG